MSVSASQAALQEYPKTRFLASRVCYRDKNATKQTDELAAKARVVARGDRDPDLLALRRDAPTMTRTGFYVVLNIIVAFYMTMFGGDIAGAFMQGLQELAQRDLPLFFNSLEKDFLVCIHYNCFSWFVASLVWQTVRGCGGAVFEIYFDDWARSSSP